MEECPMTATVTLELPESVLIQALRKLPPARRYELLRRIDNEALRVKPGGAEWQAALFWTAHVIHAGRCGRPSFANA